MAIVTVEHYTLNRMQDRPETIGRDVVGQQLEIVRVASMATTLWRPRYLAACIGCNVPSNDICASVHEG